MNIVRRLLDKLPGNRKHNELKQQLETIMGLLEETLEQAKQSRLLITKIRTENADTRKALSDRIKALEDIIANGTIDPATAAALKAEVDGLRSDLEAFDTDVPDPTTPTPA